MKELKPEAGDAVGRSRYLVSCSEWSVSLDGAKIEWDGEGFRYFIFYFREKNSSTFSYYAFSYYV